MVPFADRLEAAILERGNPVLVGLDPRAELLPEQLIPKEDGGNVPQVTALHCFCCRIINVVADLVPAVKVQAAFFEKFGPLGMVSLGAVIHYARQKNLLVIFDGKRNDIGSTAQAYAEGLLGYECESPWAADAVTVNPYLGGDSLEPFIQVADQRGAGVFVLVKTSNPGGGMFQDLVADGRPIYRHVGAYVEQVAAKSVASCGYGAVGAVVGATYPEQLAQLRSEMPHCWFLIPGFGAQGGKAQDVAGAFDERGRGAVINNSRGIIFAYRDRVYADRFGPSRWQEAVEAATRQMIDELRDQTPAGNLGKTGNREKPADPSKCCS